MIVEIGSTLPSFRTQRFHPGLNVLLADRTRSSAETGSRNGAGKSSLVEIVHFLLGGRVGRGSVLRADALRDVTFHGVFTFGGHSVTARRKPSDPSKVRIETRHPDAAFIGWESDDDGPFVELDAWCEWLGKSAFGLPMPKPPSLPSFRAMFGFFARRREDGGFLLPSTYEPQIPRGKTNFALAYLLDLGRARRLRPAHALQRVGDGRHPPRRAPSRLPPWARRRNSKGLATSIAIGKPWALAASYRGTQR